MKIYKDVHSSTMPVPIEVLETKVFIYSDIVESEIETEEGTMTDYSFTMTEYSKDEYIAKLSDENDSLSFQLTDAQLALCDLYEMILEE